MYVKVTRAYIEKADVYLLNSESSSLKLFWFSLFNFLGKLYVPCTTVSTAHKQYTFLSYSKTTMHHYPIPYYYNSSNKRICNGSLFFVLTKFIKSYNVIFSNESKRLLFVESCFLV